MQGDLSHTRPSRATYSLTEGDLIIGLNSSAIGTLVERATRFTVLLHLPPMNGHGGARAKNGPPLAGHGAEAVRDAITAAVSTLPRELRRSLTWDQGNLMFQHPRIEQATGLKIYFADPHSPWQRGSNENIYWCKVGTAGARLTGGAPARAGRVTPRTRAAKLAVDMSTGGPGAGSLARCDLIEAC